MLWKLSHKSYFIQGHRTKRWTNNWKVQDLAPKPTLLTPSVYLLNQLTIVLKTAECVHPCKVKQRLQIIQAANQLLLRSTYLKGIHDVNKFVKTIDSIFHCLNTALEILHFWEVILPPFVSK